jgi:hypothetical protein
MPDLMTPDTPRAATLVFDQFPLTIDPSEEFTAEPTGSLLARRAEGFPDAGEPTRPAQPASGDGLFLMCAVIIIPEAMCLGNRWGAL